MSTRIALGGMVVVACCACAARPDPKEPVTRADPQDIAVSIAVPALQGQRTIFADRATDHFHVVIENISKKPQQVWSEQCSFGYACLTFEITDGSGASATAKKKPVSFRANIPVPVTLAPGEKLVLEAHPRADTWQDFLLPATGARKVSMRAVFEIAETKLTKANAVWTGKATSPVQDYVFVTNPK